MMRGCAQRGSPEAQATPSLTLAGHGNVGALAHLREVARQAIADGRITSREGLAAAECYARLAAAIGTDQDRRELVSILLERAEALARVNLPHMALRREAGEHLAALASGGDGLASDGLVALGHGPAAPTLFEPDLVSRIGVTFAQAANGCAQSLLGMADAAMAMTLDGSPRFEGLVQAEQYSRLAHSAGDQTGTVALGAVLLLRWDDRESAAALDHAVEAFNLLLPLVEQGQPHAVALVSTALTDLAPRDLAYFATRAPHILAHCSLEGTA